MTWSRRNQASHSEPVSAGGGATECEFAPCTCPIPDDSHCGPTCRLGIGESGEPCKCGHAECSATIGEAPVDP